MKTTGLDDVPVFRAVVAAVRVVDISIKCFNCQAFTN